MPKRIACKLTVFLMVIIGLSLCQTQPFAQGHGQDFHSYHGKARAFPKINYDSLFQNATELKDSENGKKLLNKCLDAYGGEEHLRKLQSYKTYWTMEGLTKGTKEPVIRTFVRDGRYRIERLREDWPESRTLNKSEAWFQNPDTAFGIVQGRYKAEVYSYLILSMPLGVVDERFDDIRYGGSPDDTLQYIYLHKSDSVLIALGIDSETYHLKTCAGVIKESGASLTFVNLLSDFREESGYIFPHKLINVAMGLKVGDSVLDSVKINPDLVSTFFEYPQ